MTRIALTAGALLLAATTLRATETPRHVIDRLDAAMLAVVTEAEPLGFEGRTARLEPVIAGTFDIAFMAEKVLGRHWKALSPDDRRRWIALFREFMIATWAGNLDRHSGTQAAVLGEDAAAHETVIVRTRVADVGGDDVDVDYRLHETPDGWRIIDVYLNGTVSELALRRADYSSVLARDGFPALVQLVRGKIGDLAAGRGRAL